MLYTAICAKGTQTNRTLMELGHQLLQERQIPHTFDTFSSHSELVAILKKNPLRYDIAFLELIADLQPAIQVRAASTHVSIALLCDTPALAVDGYRVEAIRYLQPPLTIEMLEDIFSLLQSRYQERRLTVRTHEGLAVLQHEDILFLRTVGRCAEIVSVNQNQICLDRLSELLLRLPTIQFVRTHQSYAVNLYKIEALSKTSAHLQNGHEIPVSRRLHADIQERLERYGFVLSR